MKQMLTTKDLAAMLHRKVETVRGWRAAGKGPAYRQLGARQILYDPDDVQTWLDSKAVDPSVSGEHEATP